MPTCVDARFLNNPAFVKKQAYSDANTNVGLTMPYTTEMVPSSIRFSQNDIRATFTHGDKVHDVIDRIKENVLSLDAFLPMDVALTRGKFFTGNNRTLYVCRVLQYEGLISTVTVRVVSPFFIFCDHCMYV